MMSIRILHKTIPFDLLLLPEPHIHLLEENPWGKIIRQHHHSLISMKTAAYEHSVKVASVYSSL